VLNQDCIASYDSSGIDIVVKELLLVEISLENSTSRALSVMKEEWFVGLRRAAATMLLSLMESRPVTYRRLYAPMLYTLASYRRFACCPPLA
jgi:hypothetical protein